MENGEDDFTALGTVRRAWLKGRCIVTAEFTFDLTGPLAVLQLLSDSVLAIAAPGALAASGLFAPKQPISCF